MSAPVLLYTATGDAILVRRPCGFARAVEVEPWKTDEVMQPVPGQLLHAYDPWFGWNWDKAREDQA